MFCFQDRSLSIQVCSPALSNSGSPASFTALSNSKVLVCSAALSNSEPITIKDLSYNVHLTSQQIDKLVFLINEYRCCFSQNNNELGKTDLIKMSIHLFDDKPVVYRPYRLSHNERKVVRDIVNNLLSNDVIRESDSPYSSPILLVKKKNGEQRL